MAIKLLFFLIILLILFISTLFTHELSSSEVSSNSPFECGFESTFSLRVPFSIHFFSIVMIFLIFDLEVVIIFPVVRTMIKSMDLFIVYSIMMIILMVGLLMEWNEGTLEWSV